MRDIKNNIIDHAKLFCLQRKERLTRPRMEVLKIIAASSKPLKAYEILERLAKVMVHPKPPTAYRAIDFWLQQGFIHSIESLNAYVICHAEHRHQGSQFMICDHCGLVIETHLHKLPKTLEQDVTQNSFSPSSWNLEIHGLCRHCHIAEPCKSAT